MPEPPAIDNHHSASFNGGPSATSEAAGDELPPSDGDPQVEFSWRAVIVMIYLPNLLVNVGFCMLPPVLPLFAKVELGCSDAVVGLVVASNGFGQFFFNLPAGAVVTAVGIRATMLLGLLILAASGLMAWGSVGVVTLIGATVVRGIGVATWQTARMSFIAGWVPRETNGKVNSFMGGVMRLANVLGPAMGGVLVTRFNMRVVFLAAALFTIPAALVILLTMPHINPVKKKSKGGCGSETSATLVEHAFTFLTAGAFCFSCVMVRTSRTLLLPLQGHEMGLRVDRISYLISASYTAELFLFWISGLIMDRYGRKWCAVPANITMGLGLILLPMTQTYAQLMGAAMCFGVGSTLGSGIVQTLTTDFTPAASGKNEFLGIFRSITKLGTLLGPVVTGGLAEVSLLMAGLVQGGLAIVGGVWAAGMMYETLPSTDSDGQGAGDFVELETRPDLEAGSSGECSGEAKGH